MISLKEMDIGINPIPKASMQKATTRLTYTQQNVIYKEETKMKQTTTKFEFTVDNVAKWLKDSTDWLIDHQEGCCTLKLDDRLAICVGWSNGFGDEPREDIIQAIDDLD